LRIRIKQAVMTDNVRRAVRALGQDAGQVLVVGGPAADEELLSVLSRSMPGIIGRGNVNGTLGPRYAVALGLALALDPGAGGFERARRRITMAQAMVTMRKPEPGPMRLRIKSPLLSSIILLELLSNNASMCRELPFCPVARIRALLRIPSGAGPYRGIRANMEQTSACTGLDHYGRGVRVIVGRGIDARHASAG
jgi:Diol dehydratase reactivase ATPase-like domain